MAESPIKDVSDTAFWVAHYRYLEGALPNPLFKDPLAGVLAGERGRKIASSMPGSKMTAWNLVIRTLIIDRFIEQAVSGGVDAVVNLGAGLDTRPYRLKLPPKLHWTEVDYPRTMDFKNEKLSNEKAICGLERVGLDLSDISARKKLLGTLNSQFKKILILTEGVLPYLSVEEAGSLADDLLATTNAHYWIVDFLPSEVQKYRKRAGVLKKMQNAPFKFHPRDWFGFFKDHGWKPGEMKYLVEEGEKLNRPIPLPLSVQFAIRILGLLAPKERRGAFKRSMGYALMERIS